MPYIDTETLRKRLPQEGSGIEDEEIDLAIEAAVERVAGLTGDTSGASALTRSAAADIAEAKILDIIMPRDARDRESSQSVLRQAAADAIASYLDIERNKKGDQDVRWSDVPPITITAVEPVRTAIALD